VLDLILPPPSQIVFTLVESIGSIFTGGTMLGHLGTTLTEVLVGFFISIVIGGILAVLMSEFKLTRDALYPYIVAFNATPTIALAPLFIVWFGVGIESKIILVITGATFPIIVSTMAGLLSTGDDLQRLMRSMGATRWEIFRRVRLQTALPYFFSGLELAIVSAAIGAVVGEFSGGNSGLGYVTLLAQDTYNLDLAFATLIILAAMGIILHRLVVIVRDRVVFWAPGSSRR
jgi:NitT/TauT family transport system permease protein